MSGKILIEWKHSLCKEVANARYMDPDTTRSTHIDIANIFFNPEQDDSDEISSEHNSGGKTDVPLHEIEGEEKKKSKLSFQNQFRSHPGAGSDCPFLLATERQPTKPIKKYLFENLIALFRRLHVLKLVYIHIHRQCGLVCGVDRRKNAKEKK